jgi:hypothetical protein
MIDCKKLFAVLAHRSLRSEQFFGSDFVRDQWVFRNVAKTIDRSRDQFGICPDQAATFFWTCFTSMRAHLVNVRW